MTIARNPIRRKLGREGSYIEQVTSFMYLGIDVLAGEIQNPEMEDRVIHKILTNS